MSRRRRKPATPEQIAATRQRREANAAEKARLVAQGCEVFTDRQGQITGAARFDVFEVLRRRSGKDGRPALDERAYQAFRDHERDVHIAIGAETPERRPDYIRASTEGAPGQNVSQAMVDASARIEGVYRRLSPRAGRLLAALMVPGAGLITRWRVTVGRVSGERREEAMAVLIRGLGEDVADARQAMTRARPRAMNDDRHTRGCADAPT